MDISSSITKSSPRLHSLYSLDYNPQISVDNLEQVLYRKKKFQNGESVNNESLNNYWNGTKNLISTQGDSLEAKQQIQA